MRVISRFASRFTDYITTPYTMLLLFRDPAIPRSIKLRAILLLIAIFAYIVSPIDLVPDFQPFIGWLDDLVIIPLGISLADRLVPGGYISGKRQIARVRIRRASLIAAGAVLAMITLGGLSLTALVYAAVRLATR